MCGKSKKYVELFANTFNTAGKARGFHTSLGNNINISGGDYVWLIDNH